MATVTTEHYRAYTPRPFTRQERDSVTILFGGLHWRAERILQAVLEGAGYRARILPMATKDDLLTGREVADIGQCCPTSFTTGNLVNFLKGEASRIGVDELNKRYIYLTAGSCGACRFCQNHQSYELALRNSGLGAFRMFLMAQDQLDQKAAMSDGLDLTLPLTLGLLWAIFVTDLVQDLEYQVRPYEVVPGATEAVVKDSIEYLYGVFRDRPKRSPYRAVLWHLTTGYFTRALREVHDKFAAIEVDRLRVKPMVKITGEFYLQTVEGDPNYNIHHWLESEGAEGVPQEEGAHDLRALAVLLHAEHHVHRRDGGRHRPSSRSALRAARDQGRRRGPRALALPDDPHRGQEARATRVRRHAAEHGTDARPGARVPRGTSGDEEGNLSGAARRPRGGHCRPDGPGRCRTARAPVV